MIEALVEPVAHPVRVHGPEQAADIDDEVVVIEAGAQRLQAGVGVCRRFEHGEEGGGVGGVLSRLHFLAGLDESALRFEKVTFDPAVEVRRLLRAEGLAWIAV